MGWPWKGGRRRRPCGPLAALCLILLGLLLIVIGCPQKMFCAFMGCGLCCAGSVLIVIR